MTAKRNKKYVIIGIDEAGRGPLAGPISAGIVAAEARAPKILKGIRDSKKLSEKQREAWFLKIKSNFKYACAMVGNETIDRVGIQKATRLAVKRVLKKIGVKPNLILLDGSLFAPQKYNQKTIVKGDEKIPIISAASVVAKVLRDRKMKRLHKIYPKYGFDIHKGYGTRAHYRAIKKYGICSLHRKSYLKKWHK